MTILILHGIEGNAGDHWEQWLHDELQKQGHTVIMPSLPNAFHPVRNEWFQTIKHIHAQDLVIIGHSLGVATALDFIEQSPTKVKALISVAGVGFDYGSELNSDFMRGKQIDFVKVKNNVEKSFVIFGDNDPYVPQNTLHDLADALGVSPQIIPNGGHLNTDAGYTTFPLLLEIVERL